MTGFFEELELGHEVQDRVTGFKGIAIARTSYLQGCDHILVQPKANVKDGTIPEAQSFDEPDLKVIGRGILPKPEPEPKKNGGPRPMAMRAQSPQGR